MDFDVLLIGAGQAAVPLAHALAKAGRVVAVAERRHLGGSCVNFGCTPTKAVIASARAAHVARRGAAFGLRIPRVEVDFPAVLGRAASIVAESRGHLARLFAHAGGNPRLLTGHAKLEGRARGGFRVVVDGIPFTARRVILDTGTRTAMPPIDGLDRVELLHAGNWLERPELPGHLAILGAGFVGLEMAQLYRRLGVRVCVLEKSERILKGEDADVAAAFHAMLESEGIQFRLATRVERITRRKGALHVSTTSRGLRGHLDATHLFLAAGRKPNTDDLGLAAVGLRLPRSGIVPVNERLETSVRGLYAAGDIRGGAMFTHTAWDDFRVLESQLLGDGSRTTRRLTPYAIFTDPELARVGLGEREAKRSGRSVLVGRFEMRENGRARERGETEGFVKVVVDARSGRLLGASLLAPDASELVHLLIDVMTAGAPAAAIRDAIHIHPTLAEAVQSAVALAVPARR